MILIILQSTTHRKLKCQVIVFTHRFRFTRHLVLNHVGGGESEGERRRRSLVISAKCRNQRKRALMGACQRQRVPYYSRCPVQIKDMLCNRGEKKERQNGRLIHEVGGSNPYRGSRCSPKGGMLDCTHVTHPESPLFATLTGSFCIARGSA